MFMNFICLYLLLTFFFFFNMVNKLKYLVFHCKLLTIDVEEEEFPKVQAASST